MKIYVRAKPKSKVDGVERISDNTFVVKTKAPALNGRANEIIVKLLAKHLKVTRNSVRIIHGQKNKEKIVEVFKKS